MSCGALSRTPLPAGQIYESFPLLGSGLPLDLEHLESWGCAGFRECLLQNWCVASPKAFGLSSPACFAWIILQQLSEFPFDPSGFRDTRNLALTPAELVEIRATSSSLNLCVPLPYFSWVKGQNQIPDLISKDEWQAVLPTLLVPQWWQLHVPCPQCPCVWSSDMVSAVPCDSTPASDSWREKQVFVDEVLLIFDWDLLSVIAVQCRKCCQWISGEKLHVRQQEIKKYRAAEFVLLYLVLFVRLSGTHILYFRWCLTVPENMSFKSFALIIFCFSMHLWTKHTQEGCSAIDSVLVLQSIPTELFWKWFNA